MQHIHLRTSLNGKDSPEKHNAGPFRRHADVTEGHTYTHLDGRAGGTPSSCGAACCSWAASLHSVLLSRALQAIVVHW